MEEDEKEAIYRCNELIKNKHKEWIGISNQIAIETLLNLIKKQQKEIEVLKQENEYLNCICESDKDNYVHKEAIRELYNKYFEDIKIYDRENKKRDNYYYECIKICDILKEILGE